MKAWELVQHLNEQMEQHGRDLDVVIYDNGTQNRPHSTAESEFPDFDVEYNADNGDPVILLSF